MLEFQIVQAEMLGDRVVLAQGSGTADNECISVFFAEYGKLGDVTSLYGKCNVAGS